MADELAGQAPGILAWVVRGAAEYAAAGSLHPFSAAVAQETAAYRADEDPLRDFIARWVVPAEDDRVTTVTDLHLAYSTWADGVALAKAKRLNPKRFGRAFAERYTQLGWPVERTTASGRTAYRGLRIRAAGLGGWEAYGSDGGDGGFQHGFAGTSHAPTESGGSGGSASKPTDPTDRPEMAPEPGSASGYDEDLAERATDDDAEPLP